MTEPISQFLAPIQARVEEAEAKREKSRKNPDPIWDASMILAIQASSADVPTLLRALAAAEAAMNQMSDVAERVYEKFDRNGNGSINSLRQAGRAVGIAEALRVIRAAIIAPLEECTCALVGCRHQPMLTADGWKQAAATFGTKAALGEGVN
ncbi:hypothetical protein [Paenarthrobacter sp. TA1.8]|uniref:hypothetical protein n=1 Tax=Paenarthrobacter sp. TA1.8 TaxID=3400219 RepID=UPI003B429644